MNKDIWEKFEYAVQKDRWEKAHPKAFKGKPFFPRRFYAVKIKVHGKKPEYLKTSSGWSDGPWGRDYWTEYDLVDNKKHAEIFYEVCDATENLDYFMYDFDDKDNFEWAKIITVWKRERTFYEDYGENTLQYLVECIKSRITQYKSVLWEHKALYGNFKAMLMFPYLPHNVIRRMYHVYHQKKFFRKDDFEFCM